MDARPQGRVRGPRTHANRPEVITRRALIVGYHNAGKGIREISRLMGISTATVQLWVNRFEAEGHVLTRARPGGPRVTTAEEDERLRQAAERRPLDNAIKLTRDVGLHCSPVTTRRRLREAGLNCFIPAVKENLTEAQRQCRLRFSQTYVNVGQDFWRSVIFTDETTFSSVATLGRQCWRRKNTRFQANHIYERARSGRVGISVHGWMWWGGVGELTVIDGNLDSHQYINILETSLLPSVRAYAIPEPEPIYLVQDRSPIHTSRAVMAWFRAHPQIRLVEWPTKGCDCNPIENLWALMKQEWEVEERTRETVSRKATEVWEGMRRTPDLCSRLVDSVPGRLQLVIEANGGWTRY